MSSTTTPPAETPQDAAPPPREKLAVRLLRLVPTLLILIVLAGLGYTGHKSGWKLPGSLAGGEATETSAADWCDSHSVPEEICINCRPGLMPPLEPTGWCREHGVAECVLEHPERAQLAEPPAVTAADRQRAAEALALRPRRENSRTCQMHQRRIQFASQEAALKTGIEVDFVERGPMLETVAANGEVAYDPTRVARVSARAGGTVHQVAANLGDRVQAGQLLALVDSAQVGQAKAQLLQIAAEYELKAETYRRFLGAEDAISRQRLLEAQNEMEAAELALESSVQALVNLGLPLTLQEVRSHRAHELFNELRWLGLPTEVTATLDPAASTANLLPVFAPREGIITQRDVVAGEVIAAGQPVFQVVDTSGVWLLVDVAQEDAPFVELGQELRFHSDGVAQEVVGEITWISTEVDPQTRTVKVRAELANTTGRLRAEMYGAAQIVLREDAEAIVVPSEAVHWEGCCHVVFVRDANYFDDDAFKVFHTRMVRPGATYRGQTEIIAGVLPGELVATSGSGALRGELLKGNLGAGCCVE